MYNFYLNRELPNWKALQDGASTSVNIETDENPEEVSSFFCVK